MVACTSKLWHKQNSVIICIWNASQRLVSWRFGFEIVTLIASGRAFRRQNLEEEVGYWQSALKKGDLSFFQLLSLCSSAFCYNLKQLSFPPCSLLWYAILLWSHTDRVKQSQLKYLIQSTDGVSRASGSCTSFPEGPPSSHQPLPMFPLVNIFLPYWSNSLCAPSGSLHFPPERMVMDLLRLYRIF